MTSIEGLFIEAIDNLHDENQVQISSQALEEAGLNEKISKDVVIRKVPEERRPIEDES